MKRKILIGFLAFVLVVVTVPAALAAFGFGDIVHDPLHELSNGLHFVAQLDKTVEHMNWTIQHFKAYAHQTLQIPSKAQRWETDLVTFRSTSAPDSYGKNEGWLRAVNQGMAATNAYMSYVERMESFNGLRMALEERDRKQKQQSSLELADGSHARTLGIIGDYRTTRPKRQKSLDDLRGMSLSESDPENTHTAIMQKTNAAAVISAQNSEITNELLSTYMEMQLREATARRDAQVQEINADIYRRSKAPAYMAGQANGTTSALRALQVP